MPQKTIYIRDEDLKIFEEAEKLSKKDQIEENSLSSIIATSLQMYIQRKKAAEENFKEIVIATGIYSDHSMFKNYIKFMGKEVARMEEKEGYDSLIYTLYQTYKGKLLLHVEKKNKLKESGKSWHRIFDNIVDVEASESLIKMAQENMEETHTFYIDI